MVSVAEPQKEIRFTRSGQAVTYCVAGAVFVGVGVTLAATGYYRYLNPAVPHAAWSTPFFLLGGGIFWLATHLARHAYLILTPMGLEIFPFFRPAKGMRMVMWQEISAAELNGEVTMLTLHFNEERTAGMHLSLRPVRKNLRPLLAKAIQGRAEKR